MFRPRELQASRLQRGNGEGQIAIIGGQKADQVLAREFTLSDENSGQFADNEVSCTLKVDHSGEGGRIENGALRRPGSERGKGRRGRRHSRARAGRLLYRRRGDGDGSVDVQQRG